MRKKSKIISSDTDFRLNLCQLVSYKPLHRLLVHSRRFFNAKKFFLCPGKFPLFFQFLINYLRRSMIFKIRTSQVNNFPFCCILRSLSYRPCLKGIKYKYFIISFEEYKMASLSCSIVPENPDNRNGFKVCIYYVLS